ncbi:pyrimidine-nucleoside phosphorylase [Mycoplasmatota bacterium]|nr:pyrimidine-nucleoside phosphorylase [Mycoplasmatota bacterium]
MRVVDLIEKKRDGVKLSSGEINYLIENYVSGNIPDYQMSALLMAIFFKGLDKDETNALVKEMLNSGDTVDLSKIDGIKLDKHSTGGVGDKTSLVIGPIIASCGLKLAKMSGRGLGHTGGTIDKLESIAGFNVSLSEDDFFKQVNDIGIAIVGQSKNLVPADKLLYALRDVTGTVPSIPLIAGSIMSKKLASGADKIVLDVKVGSGAFMKSVDEATELAQTMVDIGSSFGKEVVALITNMDEPLGSAIGNALEVEEALETLLGKGPDDFTKLCFRISEELLTLAGVVNPKDKIKEVIENKSAYNKFLEMIEAQGGNINLILNDELPKPNGIKEYKAKSSGYIIKIDAEEVGKAAMLLGAGRANKDDSIDMSVGLKMKCKVGDFVNLGDEIVEIHYNNSYDEVIKNLDEIITISSEKPQKLPIIHKKIEKSSN